MVGDLEDLTANSFLKPIEFIREQFDKYDVVLLGEYHRIKQDLEFYCKLIEMLPEMGVSTIGTEFLRRADQQLINELISSNTFDFELAKQLQFNMSVFWGYKEYIDVYRAVWKVNKSGYKLNLIGLNDSPNLELKNRYHAEGVELTKKHWKEIGKGCSEEFWADAVVDRVVKHNEKVLTITGRNHSFTSFKQPAVRMQDGNYTFIRFMDDRYGNYLKKKLPNRVYNIFIHSPNLLLDCESSSLPCNGEFEELFDKFGEAGLSLKKTMYGDINLIDTMYNPGYEQLKLSDIYDGYIIHTKVCDFKHVSAIPNFINETNHITARKNVWNPSCCNLTIDEFNEGIAHDAEIQQLWWDRCYK